MIALTHEQLERELTARGAKIYVAHPQMVAGRKPVGPYRSNVFAFCRTTSMQPWTGVLFLERPCPDPRDPRPYQRDERARIEHLTDVEQARVWLDAIANLPEPRPIRANNFPSFASR